MDLGSFRRQLVLSTAALSALVAVALVLGVQLFLAGSAVDTVDRLLDDRADTLVSAVDSATKGPSALVVPAAYVDPGVAVYDEAGTLVAGYVPPHQADAFDDLSRTDRKRHRQLGSAYALAAHPFTTASGAKGVVVISERLDPYEDDERDALVVSVVAGVVLVVVATGLAAWASRRALAPVAQMARTAEGWSEHDLDQRFDLGSPTNEIRALGQTLDGLLEKVARAITTEQRLTSELAHELRTPLTAVQATAELMAARDDLDPQLREDVLDIQTSCRRMAATMTSLLELARAQSTARTSTRSSLADVVGAVVASVGHADRVVVDLDGDLPVAVPGELAVRALAPVVDNAVRYAAHVRVEGRRDGALVHVTVSDDGPGLSTDEVERIFEAGYTSGSGSGLGLALGRRIARSVGGDVDVVRSVGEHDGWSGARFVVTLPAAEAAPV